VRRCRANIVQAVGRRLRRGAESLELRFACAEKPRGAQAATRAVGEHRQVKQHKRELSTVTHTPRLLERACEIAEQGGLDVRTDVLQHITRVCFAR
jgi:hypothetical protein